MNDEPNERRDRWAEELAMALFGVFLIVLGAAAAIVILAATWRLSTWIIG